MSPARNSAPLSALDVLLANPPYGSGSFVVDALGAGGDDLAVLLPELPAAAPDAEPAVSGLAWVWQEWDRLRALPFATSDAGSDTDPPVRACDVVLSARIRRRASHLAAVAGAHWPEKNRITITTAPGASRAEVSETLLHELVHAANHAPIYVRTGRRLAHDYYFRLALIEAAKQAYGLELPEGAARWRSWQVDDHLVRELEDLGGQRDIPVGR